MEGFDCWGEKVGSKTDGLDGCRDGLDFWRDKLF